MIKSLDIRIYLGGTLLFLLCVCLSVLYSNLLWLAAPIMSLAAWYGLQHPQVIFYALVLSVPWSAEVFFPSGPGTDLPDEPLMLLTTLAVVFITIYRRLWRSRIHPLVLLLAIQFTWTAITVLLSTHPLFSIKYGLAKSWYLLAFVAAPMLFIRHQKQVAQMAMLLAGSMVAVTVVCLLRQILNSFSFAYVNNALQPFFRNHVNYSALLVCTIPIQIAAWQLTATWKRRIVSISIFITLIALYFSYSRGAWLALPLGLSAAWLIKRRWLLKAFAGACLVVTLGLGWLAHNDNYLRFAPNHDATIFHTNFSEHLSATYQGKDVSTAERFYRWVAGVRMAEDSWPHGFGPTTFYQHYKSYTLPLFRTWVSDNREQSTVHNYYLLLLIEQGAVGLLLFLALIASLLWYAQRIYHRTGSLFWKTVAAAVASILFMQCVLNFLSDLVETDKVGSVFYLCVAVLVVAHRLCDNAAVPHGD